MDVHSKHVRASHFHTIHSTYHGTRNRPTHWTSFFSTPQYLFDTSIRSRWYVLLVFWRFSPHEVSVYISAPQRIWFDGTRILSKNINSLPVDVVKASTRQANDLLHCGYINSQNQAILVRSVTKHNYTWVTMKEISFLLFFLFHTSQAFVARISNVQRLPKSSEKRLWGEVRKA